MQKYVHMGRLEFKNNKDEIGSIKYTEENIQFALNNFFTPNSVRYAIDGQYVFGWESDKLIMMRSSGLVYEFEIKISKADFKNDFKNKQRKHTILEGKEEYNKLSTKLKNFFENKKKFFIYLDIYYLQRK